MVNVGNGMRWLSKCSGNIRMGVEIAKMSSQARGGLPKVVHMGTALGRLEQSSLESLAIRSSRTTTLYIERH